MFRGFYELGYWPLAGITFLSQKAPPRLSYTVARLLGDLTFHTWYQGRQNTIDNMRHVLGSDAAEGEVREVARRSFGSYFSFLVDFFRFPSLSDEEIHRLSGEVTGWEHLHAALSAGRGAILVGPHFGNWEFGAMMLALRSYPLNYFARTFRSQRVTELVLRPRVQRGIKIIPTNGDIRPLYRALKRNELVGIAIDRPYPEGGVKVNFFGAPAYLPAGPAALSLRTGAKLLIGYCMRLPDETYGGRFYPAIDYAPTGDREQDIQQVTQKIADALENIIRISPEQWYMFQRLWA
ncbi:MAG: lysophospholipid acyltransferase family protein [Chloroflexi bacterium]|nr:lysophospholipid acyltransferase family protein [Chloroflexota bacterium]